MISVLKQQLDAFGLYTPRYSTDPLIIYRDTVSIGLRLDLLLEKRCVLQ